MGTARTHCLPNDRRVALIGRGLGQPMNPNEPVPRPPNMAVLVKATAGIIIASSTSPATRWRRAISPSPTGKALCRHGRAGLKGDASSKIVAARLSAA
jgi:hypothetical protein